MNTRPSLDRCRERRARVLRGERVMGEQEACPVCTEPLREDGDDSLSRTGCTAVMISKGFGPQSV